MRGLDLLGAEALGAKPKPFHSYWSGLDALAVMKQPSLTEQLRRFRASPVGRALEAEMWRRLAIALFDAFKPKK